MACNFQKEFVGHRLVVENTIGHIIIKQWQITAQIWRHSKDLFDIVWDVISAVVNMEIQINPLRH